MAAKDLLTPAAIVVAGALIGTGLCVGLRDRRPEGLPVLAQSSAAPSPLPEASPAPSPLQPPTPPAPQRNAQAVVEASAKEALLATKIATWKPKCWEPALKQNPTPAKSSYLVEMNFDPQGKEITRSIQERRDVDSRPDVAQCLRAVPMGFSVPPPGVGVLVTLPLEFP